MDEGSHPVATAAPADGDRTDTSDPALSHLLAEIARIPSVELALPGGWAPGLEPGDVVGKYVIQRELGRGGFGVVYDALDRNIGRHVAFKVVRPGRRLGPGSDRLVRAEADALARLSHPNVVTLHDLGTGPSGPFLVFELLRGDTLAGRLRAGPLPLRDALDVAVDVARVLAHAHRAGVVHRDLNPANVFLCEDGAVKVLDFGLAHLFGRAPASGGTPAYMAPEQWRSEAGDARTDLFALGVLLHHMLSGAPPYRVSRDRSEALEPGPPPPLPRRAAPAALRALVAHLLEKDPAARPQTAQAALDALLPLQRHAARRGEWARARRGLVALIAIALAALPIAVRRFRPPAPEAREPRVVVVADVQNDTNEAAIGGLSGLLITSLEQSPHLKVLSRSRLVGLLRQLRREQAPRIDEEVGRELARAAGAPVLLLGSARRLGSEYALDLRAVDAVRDADLFSLTVTAAEKDAVPGALDRLAEEARRRLGEGEEEIRGARIQLSEAVTPSVDAYQRYFEGQDCMERPSLAGSWASVRGCAARFHEALALDPTFALAHYQLAFLLETEGGARSEVDEHLASALRYVGRAPPREQSLIRAWKAHVEGRDEEALATYARVLEASPDDKQVLYLAGDLHFHRGQLGAAVPFLERALALDSGAEWPLDHLVNALGAQRRQDELRRLVAQLGDRMPTHARTHALVRALVWLGDAEAAVEAARRAVEAGAGPAAEGDLTGALLAVGDLAGAEARLRARVAEGPFDPAVWVSLAGVLGAQGRRAEGAGVLAAAGVRADASHQPALQLVRAIHAAGAGDPGALWREAARARALRPEDAPVLAVLLALTGDLPHAEELAPALAPGSAAAEEYEALVAWRRGDAAGAAARLAALEVRDPSPGTALPPSYLLAEVAGASGDAVTAVGAAERFRLLWPRGAWRSWAYPRSLLLTALAEEQLGDRERARDAVRRLLDAWRRADPGLPLLREARALSARVER